VDSTIIALEIMLDRNKNMGVYARRVADFLDVGMVCSHFAREGISPHTNAGGKHRNARKNKCCDCLLENRPRGAEIDRFERGACDVRTQRGKQSLIGWRKPGWHEATKRLPCRHATSQQSLYALW
jgi:hypothetical protein